MVAVQIRVPEELWKKVSDYADKYDISRNTVVKMAIRYYFGMETIAIPEKEQEENKH